jgi:hypothetical protein
MSVSDADGFPDRSRSSAESWSINEEGATSIGDRHRRLAAHAIGRHELERALDRLAEESPSDRCQAILEDMTWAIVDAVIELSRPVDELSPHAGPSGWDHRDDPRWPED